MLLNILRRQVKRSGRLTAASAMQRARDQGDLLLSEHHTVQLGLSRLYYLYPESAEPDLKPRMLQFIKECSTNCTTNDLSRW